MRGRIKRFIEDKGYGFITGEDGQDYFFHISQFKDMVEPKNWMIVNFDIVDGKKGKNAVNIRVSEQNNTSKPKFVTCGHTNIRLNNIKQYGIGIYRALYEQVDFDKYAYSGEIDEEAYDYYKEHGGEYKVRKCNCLYIKTYQDDYIRFFEDEVSFNIYDKYNEINNAMQYGH